MDSKQRRRCGTCRWYDGLGDLCRNGGSVRYWESVEREDGCRKWEAEDEAERGLLRGLPGGHAEDAGRVL